MSQWNRSSAAAPPTIMAIRMPSADSTPQKSTRCCSAAGMRSAPKMATKTKMLSTESDFSTRYAVRNSVPALAPDRHQTNPLKASATAIQTALQVIASRKRTSCGRRWNTPRSSASKRPMNPRNESQESGLPMRVSRGHRAEPPDALGHGRMRGEQREDPARPRQRVHDEQAGRGRVGVRRQAGGAGVQLLQGAGEPLGIAAQPGPGLVGEVLARARNAELEQHRGDGGGQRQEQRLRGRSAVLVVPAAAEPAG